MQWLWAFGLVCEVALRYDVAQILFVTKMGTPCSGRQHVCIREHFKKLDDVKHMAHQNYKDTSVKVPITTLYPFTHFQ